MKLWTIFVTGLFAGGASCAAVQGGLLAGALGRGAVAVPDPTTRAGRKAARQATARKPKPAEDVLPVAGFLVGKLVSHTILGGLLGLLGESVQLGFRARAFLQIGAGLLMLVMAVDLFGVRVARRLVPPMPARLGRAVRRSGRTGGMVGPALLGFVTVLIPCGVTLSVELLAVASGSPLAGALIMAVFVLGTSPLFAGLGLVVRRSARAKRGQVGKLAAVAVLGAGLVSINTGLVLAGSPVSFTALREAMARAAAEAAAQAPDPDASPDPNAVSVAADGTQQIVIDALNTAYRPALVVAKAGVPTTLTVRTRGTRGCTRAFVIPSLRVQKILPETGATVLNLGRLKAGRIGFTCGMGMYGGVIRAA